MKPYSAGCIAGFARAGFGAPTRSRRSVSDSVPPITMTIALKMPPAQQAIVVAFAALPTASSAYVLAARMGGDGSFVAGLVTLSTLIGMAGLPLALLVLQLLA